MAILLISLLQKNNETKPDIEKYHEKKVINEPKITFHEHLRANVKKEHKKKKELALPTILSLLVALGIFLMFQSTNGSPEIMIVFALSLGFIVFISITFMFKHRITKNFWRLVGTKLYIILLIISIVFTAYDYYQTQKNLGASFQDYIGQNFLGLEKLPTDIYVFTWEGTLLWSGLETITGEQEISSDVFSGMIESSDVTAETGTVLETSTDTTNSEQLTTNDTPATTIGNQKLMDAVIYLLKKYEIPLSTKKDISFTYVTTANPYYTERRTAYANKMIGKTTNPSKYIVCESYIVMKWLLEKRNVVYTSTTVLDKFRAEAVKRDALNGCIKGKIVTDKTL